MRSDGLPGYGCEVVAEGLVYGTGRTTRYVLGTWWTLSPVLALRWLGGQALRIADRLDPEPGVPGGWVTEGMRRPVVPVPDCPTELRVWAGDVDEQRFARKCLRAGRPLVVAVPDADCRYTLSIRPDTGEPGHRDVRKSDVRKCEGSWRR